MVSCIRNGMRDSSAATVAKPFGCGRRAPLGVPLVPEVSTINRPPRAGLRKPVCPSAIRSSIEVPTPAA